MGQPWSSAVLHRRKWGGGTQQSDYNSIFAESREVPFWEAFFLLPLQPIDSSIRRPLLLLLELGLLVVILHRYTTKLCSTFREVVDFALYTFKGPPVLHNQTSRESRSPETKQMTAKSIQNLKSWTGLTLWPLTYTSAMERGLWSLHLLPQIRIRAYKDWVNLGSMLISMLHSGWSLRGGNVGCKRVYLIPPDRNCMQTNFIHLMWAILT